MGIKYMWDTNTVIYYLQQQFSPSAEKFMDKLVNEARPVISSITEIELLCWKTATEKDLEVLHNFIDDALVIELEQPIKYKTADIRKKHKIKLPDAIIAATALVYELTLVSRNISDFKNIEGLQLINPWDA
ncbi:MAG: type II toxin-antitoxin system VapC family toxin [Bacteroidales bacterium]|jgi:predicted nucleic acid-binding protein|nr:type II toxin-antitoxin system VapC family toxin [Bacteroidales bacterium]